MLLLAREQQQLRASTEREPKIQSERTSVLVCKRNETRGEGERRNGNGKEGGCVNVKSQGGWGGGRKRKGCH